MSIGFVDSDTFIEGEEMVTLLEKISTYERIVNYLSRMNIWEDMLHYLLTHKVKSADQFSDKEFVERLVRELDSEKLIIGNIRSCRWRPDCYEVDIAIRGKVQEMVTLGPEIPLIKEYRSALDLFPLLKEYIESAFILRLSPKGGQEKDIPCDNWKKMVETVRTESFRGSHLQRYKGLGEMNPEQLWETTMNPENRVLVRVNIEDAEKADDMFTTLMGDKVEPRREFIQNHALEVTDLDI